MPLTFKVTTAGRAALVNAANTGTLPVLVSQIGVTATGFTAAADGSDLALPGELKRLSTFGAAAVADDTIHTVIRDESADTYSLRGFALYLADGTLFGLYGQADVIVEKSAAAMMLLATDIIFADIDAASLTFGNTNFLNPPGTVDTPGVLELATDAETITGTDAVRAVTPKGLMAKLVDLLGAGAPSAFVKSLLTAVDRVAFRTLLSIKTAASYDIGVGNGLDADLLDGQHGAYYRQWGNLQGVPVDFTPSVHQHSAADITSGLLGVARGGTGVGSITAGNYIIGAGTGPFGSKAPEQVLIDIGAAPTEHSHSIDHVNGLPDALDLKLDKSAAAYLADTRNSVSFAGSITAASGNVAATSPGAGSVVMRRGTPGNTGFIEFLDAEGNRLAYLGNIYSGTSTIILAGSLSVTGQADITGALSCSSVTTSGVLARNGGPMYLRPNGSGSSSGQLYLSSSGSLSVSGDLSCVTFNASGSDIRLKRDVQPIEPRPLHRLLAALPDTHGPLTTYIHRVDGAQRRGPIAQDVERVDAAYTGTITLDEGQADGVEAGEYKTVDKAGLAYEEAMWAGAEIDRLRDIVDELQARLLAVESR